MKELVEDVKREVEDLRRVVVSVRTERVEKYVELLERLVEDWGRVRDCLDGKCYAVLYEASEGCGMYLEGPSVVSVRVPKTATVEESFELLREEIHREYGRLLKSTSEVIKNMLREGVLDEMWVAVRTVESIKTRVARLETAVREVEKRLSGLAVGLPEEVVEEKD